MKVLVTGSEGYIGKHAVRELQGRGHEVVGYDLTRGQDIHDRRSLLLAMRDCEAVVHLAAIPHAVKGKPWEDYFRTNVEGTQRVAEAASINGSSVKHLIQISSTSYFGAHKGFPFDPADGMEATSPNAIQRYYNKELPDMSRPYNPAAIAYTMSKIAAETVVAAYGMSGRLGVTVLRFFPSPHTRKPYNWGLLMLPETGGRAVADTVDKGPDGFRVEMVWDQRG